MLQNTYNFIIRIIRSLYTNIWHTLLSKYTFLPTYYIRTDNIFGDGFLLDFLQKKTLDTWVRSYVIYTGFLFSERLIFESLVRSYNDLYVWNLHTEAVSETSNTAATISYIFYVYFLFFLLMVLLFSLFIY